MRYFLVTGFLAGCFSFLGAAFLTFLPTGFFSTFALDFFSILTYLSLAYSAYFCFLFSFCNYLSFFLASISSCFFFFLSSSSLSFCSYFCNLLASLRAYLSFYLSSFLASFKLWSPYFFRIFCFYSFSSSANFLIFSLYSSTLAYLSSLEISCLACSNSDSLLYFSFWVSLKFFQS